MGSPRAAHTRGPAAGLPPRGQLRMECPRGGSRVSAEGEQHMVPGGNGDQAEEPSPGAPPQADTWGGPSLQVPPDQARGTAGSAHAMSGRKHARLAARMRSSTAAPGAVVPGTRASPQGQLTTLELCGNRAPAGLTAAREAGSVPLKSSRTSSWDAAGDGGVRSPGPGGPAAGCCQHWARSERWNPSVPTREGSRATGFH